MYGFRQINLIGIACSLINLLNKKGIQSMEDREKLISHTVEFFQKHWNLEKSPPEWSEPWMWIGSVPNYQLGGVYALFKGDELIYIGLGASRGGGRYPDSGLSRRLMAHVYRTAPKGSTQSYLPREKWQEVGITSVSTIGFPLENNYLASALEDYLIGHLNPSENSIKKKGAK